MTSRGGHTLRGPGSHPGRRPPLWVELRCGGCHTTFLGNAFTVPHFKDAPACRGCWRRLNLVLRTANLDEWDTPEDAYPDADPDQVRDEIPRVRHPGLILPEGVGE